MSMRGETAKHVYGALPAIKPDKNDSRYDCQILHTYHVFDILNTYSESAAPFGRRLLRMITGTRGIHREERRKKP